MATSNLMINNHIVMASNAVYIHDGPGENEVMQSNVLEKNFRGVQIEAATNNLVLHATIQNNQIAGVFMNLAAVSNSVNGSTIVSNGVGVLISDAGSVGNTLTGNSISSNAVLGIQLTAGGNHRIRLPAPGFLRSQDSQRDQPGA